MEIKVLGTGCAKCRATVDLIEKIAAETGAEIALEKVEEMRAIVGYGVMSTPAVVIDGKVVHKGSVPAPEMVRGWLA